MSYITLKDIAKVANVSYSTVSRALSGSPEIGEATRQRILEICRDMGYTADYVARSMVTGSTNTIGLILTNVNNPFMSELAAYVEQFARVAGFDIMLCSSAHSLEQEQQVFRLLLGRRVDGIIIVPAGQGSYASLEKYIGQVPTVFISGNSRDMPVSYVSVDNHEGILLGMDYLISLGHRDILYFGRRPSSLTHSMRVEGYLASCGKHGLTPQFKDNPSSFTSIDNGYGLAREMFEQRPLKFTAVFASSDTNALGIIKAADEAGIRIPEDLSVLGFDNISYADLPKIELSTIEQPKEAMAARAVDELISRIRGKTGDPLQLVLPPKLIKRKSCVQIGHTLSPQEI